ncbi:preprotein translocase subunit SecY [Candidatus Peregrinibacteria bacterium]|jgi:preprotein translocase subunit SecY|nr:preprotein translocase subunit SecY [Candidatus Peregrinibacteria bacterium]MBT4147756.1 preprotein translocase subunit SecY [Candidatus Peregrinibacteria bacterium]MBT4365933.1 preprotein translocase subunit SecY [Candidatus Peregrinibacteria bacterium]MBT4456558.1 preprotein translocase subunit SecY [Candidatus Peregrinibacteria bacterium]
MFTYIKQIWNSKTIRNKLLFTLGIVILYRIIAQVSVPGADLQAIKGVIDNNELLGAFSMLTGGSAKNFSILLMGLSPYINASIIMQLMTVVIPKVEELQKEGESGRKKINSFTRWLTFPLAFLQSYGMIILLNSQSQVPIIKEMDNPLVVLTTMLTITAGTVLLVWLGEQMTEKGISNGISILIFASIISQIPQMIGQGLFLAQADESKLIPFVVIVLITVVLTTVIILVNEAQRRIPVTYAGRGVRAKSDQSHLPIRINQAGMIPIIFAVSLVSFPQILAQFLQRAKSDWLRVAAEKMTVLFQPQSLTYLVVYFLLVIGFTYFYVSITFNPDQIAESIQKRGGYIPGIRPGKNTADYIGKISSRLNLFGGMFLAFIAISPMLIQSFFRSMSIGTVPLLVSGAGMIIIVGVVLEIIRQINAQLIMHDYNKFY